MSYYHFSMTYTSMSLRVDVWRLGHFANTAWETYSGRNVKLLE